MSGQGGAINDKHTGIHLPVWSVETGCCCHPGVCSCDYTFYAFTFLISCLLMVSTTNLAAVGFKKQELLLRKLLLRSPDAYFGLRRFRSVGIQLLV